MLMLERRVVPLLLDNSSGEWVRPSAIGNGLELLITAAVINRLGDETRPAAQDGS
jgi:hypothetical protein